MSTNFSLLLLTSAKLFLKNLYAAIKLGHYHFGHYFQIIFNLYSYCTRFNSTHINYYILSILSTNFSLLLLTSAKLLTKNLYNNQIAPFLTILDTISRLSSIYIHIAPDLIRYTLTTIYYSSCQQISGCYHLRVQSY